MAMLSVSTWALHRELGPLRWTRWDGADMRPACRPEPQPQSLTLTELPRRLAAMGFAACELGHFHLPPLEEITAEEAEAVRAAFADAGVVLWSLLVDYGDLSSADPRRREADQDYLGRWVTLARALGARHVRLVAGEGSPDDPAALDRAIDALGRLSDQGARLGVSVLTENFRRLCSTAEACTLVCERLRGRVHLTADFGNFPRPSRQASLAAVLPHARSIHAKIDDGPDGPAAFAHLLDLAVAAGFDGAYTVVYEGDGDQWEGIAQIAEQIRQHPRALRG